jgi:hypothetical protein
MTRILTFITMVSLGLVAHVYAAADNDRVGIAGFGVKTLGDFDGTKCDSTGTIDSTACIQATIDLCVSQGASCRNTFCPDGKYKISRPIFVDPPGNLRGADGLRGSTYNSATTYSRDFTVNYNGTPYVSLINNNTGNVPSSSS